MSADRQVQSGQSVPCFLAGGRRSLSSHGTVSVGTLWLCYIGICSSQIINLSSIIAHQNSVSLQRLFPRRTSRRTLFQPPPLSEPTSLLQALDAEDLGVRNVLRLATFGHSIGSHYLGVLSGAAGPMWECIVTRPRNR